MNRPLCADMARSAIQSSAAGLLRGLKNRLLPAGSGSGGSGEICSVTCLSAGAAGSLHRLVQ